MDRRTVLLAVGVGLLAAPFTSHAQKPANLVINLKTTKALGLAIPQSLLLRADEVIQ